MGLAVTMEILTQPSTPESHAAVPSSLIPGLPHGLLSRPLSEVFATVPDPRDPRGVRHPLSTVLTIAQAAVIAGARTLLAVGEWAAEVDREALARLGIGADTRLPSESTIRRALAGLDGDGLDAAMAAWMATRVGHLAGRTVIAVDGKSLRGHYRCFITTTNRSASTPRIGTQRLTVSAA